MSVESKKNRLIIDFIIRLEDGLALRAEPNLLEENLQALNLSVHKI